MIHMVSIRAGDINRKSCWFNIDTEDTQGNIINRCIHTQVRAHTRMFLICQLRWPRSHETLVAINIPYT